MNPFGQHLDACPAEGILRNWQAAGAKRPLTLVREDFAGRPFSLTTLLFSAGAPRERLRQRYRSFCSWVATLSPFTGWKVWWYRRAGVCIGDGVYISPGVIIDFLFPQLITLEDEVVLGLGAIVVAHIYTPDRIVVGRARVAKRGLVGGRGILAVNEIGEEGVLGANSWPIEPIPAGYIGIGVPAVLRQRKSSSNSGQAKEEKDDQRA
jgi:hypothetical protein